MGGRDDVAQPPIDLADNKAFYYRFKYNADFARFEHATEYKNNLKQLLESNPENICAMCDFDEVEKLNDVSNLKLCQELTDVKEEDSEEDFKANTKMWGAFLFRKRIKYQIGDAIFVRKSGSDKQEEQRMEKHGKAKNYICAFFYFLPAISVFNSLAVQYFS